LHLFSVGVSAIRKTLKLSWDHINIVLSTRKKERAMLHYRCIITNEYHSWIKSTSLKSKVAGSVFYAFSIYFLFENNIKLIIF
jgi:hypothetical protein